MRTYQVSYRIVPDSLPTVSILLTYTIDAKWSDDASHQAYSIMADDVTHMLGHFNEDWLKRTTVRRLK